MEPISYILGGTLVGVVSMGIGKVWGSNGKVKEATCGERRVSCNKIVDEKLHTMDEKLDIILSAIKKSSIFGV
jgi:hypothetical protein